MSILIPARNIFDRIRGEAGILRHIYAYDDTYKQVFTKNILPGLWQRAWNQCLATIASPYEYAACEYLLDKWGVWSDNPSDSFWFRKHYFPDGLSMVSSVNQRDEVIVWVYMKVGRLVTRVFDGKVLTKKQYQQECGEWTPTHIQWVDVHWSQPPMRAADEGNPGKGDAELTVYLNLGNAWD